MNRLKARIGIITIGLILTGMITGYTQTTETNTFEVLKNMEIYSVLMKELNTDYVDAIQPGELTKVGIDAMLQSLDPYTNYIPESEIEDYKFITTGQYGGIGALIHQQGDYIVISEPYEGSPAFKAGILAGDKILEINDQSAVGKSYDEVSTILKGQSGTSLQIKLQRDGVKDPIEKTINREIIKIDNIPYSGIVDQTIGYIKLTGFTQKASSEFKQAFLKLKDSIPITGLVIDLRGNGGGLLNEAVDISNLFVERGQEIVTTKGKLPDKNKTHYTQFPPVDLNIPLVILVDNQSASASEILAGAMQDLDRGVVVGQRTFGKGLVQNVVPLSYNSQLKITVAKYYIPSGRCIQAIDYSHKDQNGYFTKIPDSLIREFKTKNERIVYDGGGISPDEKTEPREFSQIAQTLFTKFLIFDYATKFYQENQTILPARDFEVTDSIFQDFLLFIKDKDYSYTTRSEQSLERMKREAEKEHYFESIKTDYQHLKDQIIKEKENDIHKYQDQIRELLKLEIVTRYHFQKGKIEASLANDPELAVAVELLKDRDRYEAILSDKAPVHAEEQEDIPVDDSDNEPESE